MKTMSVPIVRKVNMIYALLEEGNVQNQEELRKILEKNGVCISQATISRYLKELGFAKISTNNGSYRLVKTENEQKNIEAIFKLGMTELIPIGNIIVIKTRPGGAPTVAGAVDRIKLEGIVATIAGDDTLFAITKNESDALKAVGILNKYMK
ncbi:MAG: arginine repressor [Candidatus Aminicenantes bacterium]|nr:arginine repressor [Candidatus Aminicenantes bacterium]